MSGLGTIPLGTGPFGVGVLEQPVIAATTGWRYLAQRVTWDGSVGEWLDTDLPLTGVQITDVLSGPSLLTGRVDPVYARLLASDGRPLLDEGGTLVHAEADGQIRASCIYRRGEFDGPQWRLSCAGVGAQPADHAYLGEISFVGADPLDVVRHVWAHMQAQQSSNLGVAVDASTTSRGSVGTADDPYELNWWSTHDLSRVVDELAGSTPFDWAERSFWNQRRDRVQHEVVFGYPTLGTRRRDLRFVFGENIHTVPQAVRDAGESANHVIFLGAGEGRDMIRVEAMLDDGRLRRTVVVEDKSVRSPELAHLRAARELDARRPGLLIADVTVRNTVNAPLGGFAPGDEIRVQGDLDWFGAVDQWMRIVSLTVAPESPEIIGLSLVRP